MRSPRRGISQDSDGLRLCRLMKTEWTSESEDCRVKNLVENLVAFSHLLVQLADGGLLASLQPVVIIRDVQRGQDCRAQRVHVLRPRGDNSHLFVNEARQHSDVIGVELTPHVVFLVVD